MSQSIVAQLIDKVDASKVGDEEEEEVIKNVGAIAFLGKRLWAFYGDVTLTCPDYDSWCRYSQCLTRELPS